MDLGYLLRNISKFGLEFVGLYYSSYPGYVVDINDPNETGRIQVSIPTLLSGFSELPWALPKGSFSGDNYGSQVMPQVGDMVWVEFQMGKLSHPLWSHYFDLKGKKPSEFKNNKVYGFKTPAGHTVLLDDTKDGEKITITHPSGEVVVMEKEKTTITSKHCIIKSDNIELTEEGADEPLPLGNKLDSDLSNLTNALKDLNSAISTYCTTQLAASATPPLTVLVPGLTTLTGEVARIMPSLTQVLSNLKSHNHLSQKAKTK